MKIISSKFGQFYEIDSDVPEVLRSGLNQIPGVHLGDNSWRLPIISKIRRALSRNGYEVPEREWKTCECPEIFRPFQKEAVEFIENNGRALIAMDTGLGKTAVALHYLRLHPELRPAVVVCNSAVKYQWIDELRKWGDWRSESVQVINGTTPGFGFGTFLTINYDILAHHVDMLKKIKPKVVIFDEVQKIKNPLSKRGKSAQVFREVEKVICLSGTPIENRPAEFWNMLSILRPDIFYNRGWFHNRFCGPKMVMGEVQYKGSSNERELHELLTDTVLYRKKKDDPDVEKYMPDKEVIPVSFDIDTK